MPKKNMGNFVFQAGAQDTKFYIRCRHGKPDVPDKFHLINLEKKGRNDKAVQKKRQRHTREP